MNKEPELLYERLERLAIALDEIMPQCALLVRDALELLKEQEEDKPKGHWIECNVRGSKTLRCSVCGCDAGTICESNYCPNCGAKMEEENVRH